MKIKCVKMQCPVCHVTGLAQLFLNKKDQVRYCRVRHYKGLNEFKKPQFDYHRIEDLDLLKTLLKTPDFQFPTVTGQSGQRQAATLKQLHEQNFKIQPLNPKSKCLGSLAWWGTALVRTTSDLSDFKHWLETKEYSKSYIQTMMPYAKKYSYILDSGNLRDLDLLSDYKKAHAVKALTLLSKFRGNHTQFKAKLAEYGLKWRRPDSLRAFLRIFNASNNDIMKWYREARSKLRENEALFAKFLLHSGLRTSEGIKSWNLVIKLSEEGKLSEYYDSELQVLCHFKYPKLFIRRTKNCYITFVQPEFLSEIEQSKPVTYSMIRKRLERKKTHLRFNELRDKFGTWLLSHGILEAEINLCQGRIPVDIFIRHYWSPKLKELGCRIFKALEIMERSLLS